MEILYPSKPEECETDQNATVIIKSISSTYFSLDNTWNKWYKKWIVLLRIFKIDFIILILYWYNVIIVFEHIIFEYATVKCQPLKKESNIDLRHDQMI